MATLDLDGNDTTAPGADFATTFTEDQAAAAIGDTDVTITDPDDINIEFATITLTNPKAGDFLFMSANVPGIIASAYDPNTGVLTLTNPATLASYETALEAIRFRNTSDDPDTEQRQITVVVNDGTADSNIATAFVDVVGVDNGILQLSDVGVETPGLVIEGTRDLAPQADRAGWSVSWAGDVNGDGFDDVIVGAPGAFAPVGGIAGAAYVVFGKANVDITSPLSLADFSPADGDGFIVFGAYGGTSGYDSLGDSVSGVGDINGDGFDDLIVGASYANYSYTTGAFEGEAYIIFGKGGSAAATDFGTNGVIDLSLPLGDDAVLITGTGATTNLGTVVSDAGDINGDGDIDFLVAERGGSQEGITYVIFGHDDAPATFGNIDLTAPFDGFTITGAAGDQTAVFSSNSGFVSSAGDVNGDGLADLIVGLRGDDTNGTNAGAAWLVFGSATPIDIDLATFTTSNATGFQILGEAAGNELGGAVSGAGDVNGDGLDDVIIGAPGGSNEAYVVFGIDTAVDTVADIDLSATVLDGTNGFTIVGLAQPRFGLSVSNAGDVNGDGAADIILSATEADTAAGGTNSGAVYVVFGQDSAAPFGATINIIDLEAGIGGFAFHGEASGDQVGRSVSGAGDFNNDGAGDLVIGAPNVNGAAGKAYIVFGTVPPNAGPVAAAVGPFAGAEDATSPLRIEVTLSATDPNSGTGDAVETFKIETLAANGALFLAATGGSAIAAGQTITATGTGPWTAMVYFQPDANFNGSTNFTYSANDGALDGNIATASISVTAVNDPVTGAAPANASVGEDGSVAITGMSIADVDATLAPAGIYQVTLSATNGTLTMTTLAGLSFSTGGGTGDPTMTFSGTLANINTALGTASHTPNANFNGPATITLQVTDDVGGTIATGSGVATSDSDVINVTVNAVNDPVTGTAPANASVDEDGSVAIVGMSIADVDATLAPAGIYEVTLSSTNGTLTMTTLTGLSFSTGGGTGDPTMTFSGTLANINTALGTASYTPNANFNGPATITLQVTDDVGGTIATGSGVATSDSDVINVAVNSINDAPVLSDVATAASYRPGDPPVTIDPALTIGDVESTMLASATVRISAGNFAGDGDVLAVSAGGLTGTAITAVYDPGTEMLTLSGVDTLAHYEQVLEHVVYSSTNANPTNSGANPTRTIEWVLNDGSGVNNLSTPQHTTINLSTINTPNDFNGDGFSDILWQNDNGTPGIWTMDGLNRIDGANVGGFNPGPTWKVISAGDFNADSHADILWQNDNGAAGIWLMDGFNVIGDGIVGFNPGPTWKVIDAADFNADGNADILWQNDNGTAGIWTMDGLTRTGGANVGFNPGPTWHVKAAGDFDADGHADILWQNDNGAAGIWLMDEFNVIGDGIVGFNPGPTWKVIDAADFNADGHADILWQNENGTAGIWTMDGLTRTGGANVGFNPGPTWKVKTAGDYNADGRSDILWQNDNGQPGIWLMDGFNVLDDGGVGFNPGPTWHVIGQQDLIG